MKVGAVTKFLTYDFIKNIALLYLNRIMQLRYVKMVNCTSKINVASTSKYSLCHLVSLILDRTKNLSQLFLVNRKNTVMIIINSLIPTKIADTGYIIRNTEGCTKRQKPIILKQIPRSNSYIFPKQVQSLFKLACDCHWDHSNQALSLTNT